MSNIKKLIFKLPVYGLLVIALFAAAPAAPLQAADDFFAYSIEFVQPEHEKTLLNVVHDSLRQNRDKLNLSGMQLSESKLVRQELDIIAKVLESEGFYDHQEYHEKNGKEISYWIDTGGIYLIENFSLVSEQENIILPVPDRLGLATGMPLRAEDVLSAKDTLDQFLRDNNCLWQSGSTYEVSLDHGNSTADVRFLVRPAQQVSLGMIKINGLETVNEQFIRQNLELHTDQCYQSRKIENSRLRLLQSGLFSVVDTVTDPPVDGTVDVNFSLRERHHKTVRAGAGYSTDESISLKAGWQHRNFFGNAERLDVEGKVSSLFRTLETTLTIPSFMKPSQVLVLKTDFENENLDAFNATGFTTSVTLRKKLIQHLTASAGIQYEFNSVQDNTDHETFSLFSLPASLEYDRRDDLLDPRRGWVTRLSVQPYVDSLNTDILFLKTTVAASIYHTFANNRYIPTLAARTVIGSIIGNDTDSIPADERFYSGGGGSVRGFPFQKLGPVINNDPTGGRSVFELSLEARLRFSEDWGGVIFVDAGNVYHNQLPELNRGLSWATGIGARYMTALAPVRLDIAFPINRRIGIDDRFQFYVSLAQAF